MTPKPRTIGPESEDRRTDNPAVTSGEVDGPPPKRNPTDQRRAREAGVETLPDGEEEAEREAAKARDD
jgi:hypothetical protein